MNERVCRTCRWWQTTKREQARWGECALTRREAGVPAHHASKALANGASLLTTADFGCVQWERIDDDDTR